MKKICFMVVIVLLLVGLSGCNALQDAVKANNVTKVQKEVNSKSVNSLNEEGETALHIACKNGNKDIVKILLDNNANVNIASKKKETPIFSAVRTGNIDILKMLLNKNADLTITNLFGNDIYKTAVIENKFYIIKYLLDTKGENNIYLTKNNQKETLLHLLAKSGNDEIFEKTIDVFSLETFKEMDSQDTSVIYYALEGCSLETNTKLFQKGVTLGDLTKQTQKKENALYFAARNKNVANIIDICVKQGMVIDQSTLDTENTNKYGIFHEAAKSGNIGALDYLIKNYNTQIDKVNSAKYQILYLAYSFPDTKLLDFCIENKADINIVFPDLRDALDLAVATKNIELINHTMKAGYKLESKSEDSKKRILNYLSDSFDVEIGKQILTLPYDFEVVKNNYARGKLYDLKHICYEAYGEETINSLCVKKAMENYKKEINSINAILAIKSVSIGAAQVNAQNKTYKSKAEGKSTYTEYKVEEKQESKEETAELQKLKAEINKRLKILKEKYPNLS